MKCKSLLVLAVLLTITTSCFRIKQSNGGGQVERVKERAVDPKDVALPDGYRIEVITTGLTFPTGITFDEEGIPYVVEAGYSYGEVWEEPKLLQVRQDGSVRVVLAGGKNGPWNGVAYDDGFFYISEGGELNGGKILKVSKEGNVTVLVENLPGMGDHHTNGPVVKDGFVYFGQGTATNAAVVGTDNYEFGWLKRYPGFHDIPCKDIVVNGHSFSSSNPLTEDAKDKATTSAYAPFGKTHADGALVKGATPCTGAVFRIPVSGGTPELVAWGLRNPYGLVFTQDGKLYVAENGFDVRGSRPVWGTADVLWEIEQGQWYGWPDYSGGKPIFKLEGFTAPGEDPIVKILKEDPSKVPKPAAEFGVHSSSNGMDVIIHKDFGKPGNILVAQFGDMAPAVGKVWSPVGYKVVAVDPSTGVIKTFVCNNAKKNGPASWLKSKGLKRPIDVAFNPEGDALYIVDFGVLTMSKNGESRPKAKTGVVWKVTKKP